MIGRCRGRVRRIREIEAGVRPRAEIPREEPQQIGVLSPAMLAMITQAVQAAVQPVIQTAVLTEIARVREADVARLTEEAEQARRGTEDRIAREIQAEAIRAAEIAREAEFAHQLRTEDERARVAESARAEAERPKEAEVERADRVEAERAREAKAERAVRARAEETDEDIIVGAAGPTVGVAPIAPRYVDDLKRFAILRVATFDGIIGSDIEAWFRQLDAAFR